MYMPLLTDLLDGFQYACLVTLATCPWIGLRTAEPEWCRGDGMASSADGPPDTAQNYHCLQDAEHLQCYQHQGPELDNTSRLVCSAGAEGDSRAAFLYTVLVALTSVVVPLAAILNLAIVLTVLLNRKLHTVINVLVTVLGINNLVWTALPILVVIQVKVLTPALCSVRAMLFIITRASTSASSSPSPCCAT